MSLPGPVWPPAGGEGGTPSAAGLTRIEYKGGTTRASTNTSIVRYLTLVKAVGDGATVVDSATLGWSVNIVTPGLWLVIAIGRFGSNAAMAIRKNTALNNTFDLSTETDVYSPGNANTAHPLSAMIDCVEGDKIWVAANIAPGNFPDHNRFSITGPYPLAT